MATSTDLLLTEGEDMILDVALGTLHSALDILIASEDVADMIIPLGTLHAPLDIVTGHLNSDTMVEDTITGYPEPPLVVYPALDILTFPSFNDTLMEDLFLPVGAGGEVSYAFVT